jgi:signal transduction histidine kinase
MTRGALDEDVAHSPDILHRVENGPTGPTITYGFERAVPGGAPLHFVIATDERLLRAVIASFTRELSLWLSLLALALLASGLAIITLGFRPFNRLAARIAALRRGQADHIEGVFPDEIRQLVDPLNSYLARNAEIVERGRVAAGALAHSLRTPLAVVTDEAERLQQRGTESAAADVFLSESETMQRQIDYHLSRVRSGGSHAGMVGGVRLAAILSPLIAAMERCHPGKRFAATAAALDPAAPSLPMDAEDLSEILSNLLDNAGKWARSGITIDYRFDGAARRIAITDDGPGIPPDQREAMFGIGARGAGPGAGSGLGLAIARDVARDYGGDVALDRAPSGGTLATLRIGDGPAGDM